MLEAVPKKKKKKIKTLKQEHIRYKIYLHSIYSILLYVKKRMGEKI